VLLRLAIACYSKPSRLALDAHCSPKKSAICDLPRYIFKKLKSYKKIFYLPVLFIALIILTFNKGAALWQKK